MKLYPKLALTILILIILQAFFTAVFVNRTIRTTNREDARIELRQKADFMVNNYNSWKRHLWKQVIQVHNYSRLKFSSEIQKEELEKLLKNSNIDAVIVKSLDDTFSITSINSTEDFILPSEEKLQIHQNHPQVTLYYIDGQFYMIGIIRITRMPGNPTLFLVKHINGSFLKNIVFDTDGSILLHSSTAFLAGQQNMKGLAFSDRSISPRKAYGEQFDIKYQDSSYNIAISKVGEISNTMSAESVYLSTVLSNEPYIKRIESIERTVLSVSLVILLMTILLSLIFARSITRPVALLAGAMTRIRKGSYDVQLNISDKGEMSVLLQGFNGMAAKLHQDQLKLEKSLDEITFLNEFNEEIIHSIRDALAVVNDDQVIEKSNAAFDKLADHRMYSLKELMEIGFDDSLLKGISQVLSGEDESWQQRMRNNQNRIYEIKIYPIHREEHIHSDKKMCVLLLEDITEKNAYEERIVQTEKLSSVSMLSAGIAHEINNPLSSIMTNIQNLIYDETDSERRESLKLVEEESQRIAQIIRDLMNFTSREQEHRNYCSPLKTSEEVCRLMRPLKRDDGSRIPPVTITCPESISMVLISKGELMQVLINLIQNAVHASRENEAIELIILEEEENCVIQVKDKGSGMSEDCKSKIFNPFYTTKANGEGTGLGLSVVYGIIMKYKGNISVESKEAEGSCFTIRLPKAGRQE